MSSWAETIKLWETERLISFLRGDSKLEDLKLDDNFFTKLRDENITGDLFLRLTGWDFKDYGMTLRQALKLEDYIKELYNRTGALGLHLTRVTGSKSSDPPTG